MHFCQGVHSCTQYHERPLNSSRAISKTLKFSLAIIVANLKLQLLNTFLDANDVLLKRCLIILELGDLLLESGALGLLVGVVSLDLLLDSVQLVGQRLPRVLLLHGQHGLEGLLLGTQNLHLFLVGVQLLLQLSYCIIKII